MPDGASTFMLWCISQDLDVPVDAERPGDLFDQPGEQVDAEAHVAGAHDHRVARGGLEPGEVVFAHAGRADDMDDARLRRQRRHFDCAAGAVKSITPSA